MPVRAFEGLPVRTEADHNRVGTKRFGPSETCLVDFVSRDRSFPGPEPRKCSGTTSGRSACEIRHPMKASLGSVRPGLRERATALLARVDELPLPSRRALIWGHDLFVALVSLPLALLLRLGDVAGDEPVWAMLVWMAPVYVAIFAATALALRVHRSMWRYASIGDLFRLAAVVAISVLALVFLVFLVNRLEGVPRTLPFIQGAVLFLALGGSRVTYRFLREGRFEGLRRVHRPGAAIPALIVGSGPAVAATIRLLRQDLRGQYEPAGVLLSDPTGGRGQYLLGVPVLGSLSEFEDAIRTLRPNGQGPAVAILTGQMDPPVVDRLLELARRCDVRLLRAPDPLAFRDASAAGRVELRPVALEDLLERPPVHLDDAAIGRLIAGRRVLVTGAGGSIGSELVRQIAAREPASIGLLDSSELALFTIDQELRTQFPDLPVEAVLCDVRDRTRLGEVFARNRPELVFHAAALKHVPLVELNPREGVLTNVVGTRNVADCCIASGVRAMVLISTDKAVNPTNVMGASKRLAEFYCQALDIEGELDRGGRLPRFLTVRFGNVLGSSGSVVPVFQKQLERGGPLTVTHPEIERYFMTIPEAVGLVLHATAHGLEHPEERGAIFVLDMGKPVRVLEVAHKLVRLAGLEPGRDVEIVFTGLRPGEKLYEELFDDREERLPSRLDRVHLARPVPVPRSSLDRIFRSLEIACRDGPDDAVVATLAEAVPGYRPSAPGVRATVASS